LQPFVAHICGHALEIEMPWLLKKVIEIAIISGIVLKSVIEIYGII